ncbi:MAG: hypothetical protein PHN64_05520 [Desulfovibrionaceae bacterium]|nr:hypothetical protein [Desulfovibrionaceae bacterium]
MVKCLTTRSKKARALSNTRATGQETFAGRKKILLTIIDAERETALALGQHCQRLKMDVRAHAWQGGEAGLCGLLQALICDGHDLWLIAGRKKTLDLPEVRKSLALAALGATAALASKGQSLPIVIAPTGGMPKPLPDPLRHAVLAPTATTDAIMASLRQPPAPAPLPCRLAVHCPPRMGLWLEAGPLNEEWQGALCGLSGVASPLAHAVSTADRLLEQREMQEPMQGLHFSTAMGEFTAWGVKNTLSPQLSYFVRMHGLPDALLVGALPQAGAPDLTCLSLI